MKDTQLEKKSKQAIVDWNKVFPVGTVVTVNLAYGQKSETTTKSIAFLSDVGTPVIMLHGSAKAFPLYQVKPVKMVVS